MTSGDRFEVLGLVSGELAHRIVGSADRKRASVIVFEPISQPAQHDRLSALRLGGFVEQPEWRPHVPHFVTDHAADDRGHFVNGEECRPSRPVGLAGVACRIEQCSDGYSGNIVDRGRSVTALPRDWQRQKPEIRSERHHLQVGAIRKEAGIDAGVRDARKRREHPIDKPELTRQERRVVRPGEPLRKPNDLFKACLARSGRKCRSALDHERMVRRAVVGSLHTAHRVHQLTGIKDVRNHDLGAAALEQIAASVPPADDGSYRPAFGQQLSDYRATGLSGRAGHQNFWNNHSSISVLGTIPYRGAEQMVRYRTGSKRKMSPIKKTKRLSPSSTPQPAFSSIRARVLSAAFTLFREHGFSSTSMLDIVTRARVSKRDLYALFKNKHAVLAASISEHAQQMRRPLEGANPVPQTKDALAALLVEFGVSILQTICHPNALTVFRLAIAESDRVPQIGRTLEGSGREANQKVLIELIKNGQARGLIIAGDPAVLASHYIAVLGADLLIRLLMRVREAPTEREIVARARAATEILISTR